MAFESVWAFPNRTAKFVDCTVRFWQTFDHKLVVTLSPSFQTHRLQRGIGPYTQSSVFPYRYGNDGNSVYVRSNGAPDFESSLAVSSQPQGYQFQNWLHYCQAFVYRSISSSLLRRLLALSETKLYGMHLSFVQQTIYVCNTQTLPRRVSAPRLDRGLLQMGNHSSLRISERWSLIFALQTDAWPFTIKTYQRKS